MSWLWENPLPIWACGAVLATFAGLVFLARRNLVSLLTLVAVVLMTFALVLVERWVVTESESIEAAMQSLMVAIEAGDLPGVLAHVDPASKGVRDDATALLPLLQIENMGASSLVVEVDMATNPPQAPSEMRLKVDGIHTRSGQRLFYFDRVLLLWVKKNDRWLVSGYTPLHKGQPIDAVGKVRGLSSHKKTL